MKDGYAGSPKGRTPADHVHVFLLRERREAELFWNAQASAGDVCLRTELDFN